MSGIYYEALDTIHYMQPTDPCVMHIRPGDIFEQLEDDKGPYIQHLVSRKWIIRGFEITDNSTSWRKIGIDFPVISSFNSSLDVFLNGKVRFFVSRCFCVNDKNLIWDTNKIIFVRVGVNDSVEIDTERKQPIIFFKKDDFNFLVENQYLTKLFPAKSLRK
jgi:hypothetical protein